MPMRTGAFFTGLSPHLAPSPKRHQAVGMSGRPHQKMRLRVPGKTSRVTMEMTIGKVDVRRGTRVLAPGYWGEGAGTKDTPCRHPQSATCMKTGFPRVAAALGSVIRSALPFGPQTDSYNLIRPHAGINGLTPWQRVNNLLGNDTEGTGATKT